MSMDSHTAFNPKGLIFGVLLPGAGHMATGQMARGLLIAAGVLGLFFGGIFIGGIDVIDSQEDRIWFVGEALVGPLAFAIDGAHQNLFKAYDPSIMGIANVAELEKAQKRSAYPDEMRVMRTLPLPGRSVTIPVFTAATPGSGPPNKKSIAKVNELGTLFATIAGMMNLIAIIDAAFPTTRKQAAKAAAP
jgi:hypothetical protein